MLGIIRWIASKAANYWDFLSWFAGWLWTIGGGILTGWAASAANILPQYAPLSWVGAGLLGALIASAAGACIGVLRNQLAKASAVTRWSKTVDSINPLDTEFIRKRIRIAEIANPLTRRVENKRFSDCEIIGPANLYFKNNVHLYKCGWSCDIIVVLPGKPVMNGIFLKDVELVNCTIQDCTLMIPEELVSTFHDLGAPFLTLTGVAEIDAQIPKSDKS